MKRRDPTRLLPDGALVDSEVAYGIWNLMSVGSELHAVLNASLNVFPLKKALQR